MEKIINTSVKHLRNRCWDISLQATDANPQPGNKGKVLTSTKSLRFIPWPPWMPVQIFKPIHQVVVPIFKSAPKRWSDRSAIDRTTTVAGTMASTDLKMQSVTDYRPVVYAEEDNWAVRGYKLFNNSIQQLTINPPPMDEYREAHTKGTITEKTQNSSCSLLLLLRPHIPAVAAGASKESCAQRLCLSAQTHDCSTWLAQGWITAWLACSHHPVPADSWAIHTDARTQNIILPPSRALKNSLIVWFCGFYFETFHY